MNLLVLNYLLYFSDALTCRGFKAVEEIRERKRNPKPPNPKPEREMGKREKDKTRKRKTQRLFPHPKKETSLAFGVPYRFDRLGSARIPLRHGGSTPKMTSRSPRIMSAPELKISSDFTRRPRRGAPKWSQCEQGEAFTFHERHERSQGHSQQQRQRRGLRHQHWSWHRR